jgi:DNA-binding transcriptional MerR regulator
MSTNDVAHVSIGDVLNQLRDEFPDVTISKIRFLESQGLVCPERTASGYRKFYAADIARLRWILRQQKEHFLPLKVIKDRLEELDRGGVVPGDEHAALESPPLFEESAPARGKAARGTKSRRSAAPDDSTETAGASEPAVVPAAAAQPAPPDDTSGAHLVVDDDPADDLAGGATGVSLTRTELARAAELTDDELVQLEEYGLVVPSHRSRDRVLFDDDALEVARIAGAFMRHGVEPRHLRMYRAFADREAGLFEQVLLPFRRRRNPDAQERGEATLRELAHLGRRLRTALLRGSIRRSGPVS